jgi:gamma-glutamylcyclotransferase (GGCT)/AIG2-like uncharacterized protein YtfP
MQRLLFYPGGQPMSNTDYSRTDLMIYGNLFVYGTLMEPRVVEYVLGRRFQRSSPAVLPGYRRFRVKDQAYPGITPSTGDRVEGLLVFEVADQLTALDRYEGPSYSRQTVEVIANNDRYPCHTYVLRAAYPALFTDTPWDFSYFLANNLEDFLDTYS